jgi:diguanylate cyclase (GGDEF)-like protein
VAAVPVAALGVAAAVGAAGADAYWLCVLVAVLAGAAVSARGAAALLALFAVVAAATPAFLEPGLGPLPPLLLAVAVPGLSAAIARILRERLEAGQAALQELARLDPLTGLCNRRALDDRLAYEVARHSRHGRSFALMALDLNDFKSINERFGHSGGDELLRDVGLTLRAAVREQDTVARVGGDEFRILAPETDREEAMGLGERLRPAVRRATGGFEDLSGSVGYAIFPEDGSSGSEILAAADVAQAEDKRRSRARPARARA